MVNNWSDAFFARLAKQRAVGVLSLLCGLAVVACAEERTPYPGSFQGVVELDERTLAFEVSGRLDSVRVHRGDPVQAGQVIATLDASLERMTRESRESEAQAAESQVALLKAGTRPEELSSMAAQVRAAQASESQIEKSLARERNLAARGVTPQAVVDDLESQLARAQAQRQSLEHQLRAMQQGARREEIASAASRAESLATAADLEKVRLDRFELKAGTDGVILDVHAEEAEVVGPGTPVATLGDVAHPYCDVFVPQGQIGGISVGLPATLHVDSAAKPFTGKVEYIARTTEFTPRFLFSNQERPNLVIRVRVRVDDPKRELHAGVPAFVDLPRSGK